MPLSPLGQRVVTALVLVSAIAIALFALPARGWGCVLLLIVAAGAHEWARLARLGEAGSWLLVATVIGIGAGLLFVDSAGFAQGWPTRVVLAVCGVAALFWLVVAPFMLASNRPGGSRAVRFVIAVIVLIGAWVALVELKAHSPWLVLAAMATVWIADTAAYFAGRRFGKHKLAPSISPGKSWEGVFGGLAAVGVYALLIARFAGESGYTGPAGAGAVLLFVVFAMLIAAISVAGDLFESMLKRHAGVKDSGSLLPGHGGVLDRIDAMLAAMPAMALAATWFLAKGSP